jgi:hypothetical protein
MHIDNDTTPAQLVELLGSAADERDGRILLGLLSREGVMDTDELTEDEWLGLLDEAANIGRTEGGDPPAEDKPHEGDIQPVAEPPCLSRLVGPPREVRYYGSSRVLVCEPLPSMPVGSLTV